VGKQADLAAVRLSELETQPLFNVVSQLVYASGRHQVTDVWIAGQRKLAARELVDIDTAAILAKTRAWRERIAAA
jgi:5-methylthioadenosine/S-adenosylhomocysteine deaminase